MNEHDDKVFNDGYNKGYKDAKVEMYQKICDWFDKRIKE